MYPDIYSAVCYQSHPSHQACGDYFIAPKQAEQHCRRHRVCRMGTAKTVSSADILMHEVKRVQHRFMRRTKPHHKRFDESAAGPVTESNSNPESRQYEQHGFPIGETINDGANQQCVERQPCFGTAHIPHHHIRPLTVVAVNPKQYGGVSVLHSVILRYGKPPRRPFPCADGCLPD